MRLNAGEAVQGLRQTGELGWTSCPRCVALTSRSRRPPRPRRPEPRLALQRPPQPRRRTARRPAGGRGRSSRPTSPPTRTRTTPTDVFGAESPSFADRLRAVRPKVPRPGPFPWEVARWGGSRRDRSQGKCPGVAGEVPGAGREVPGGGATTAAGVLATPGPLTGAHYTRVILPVSFPPQGRSTAGRVVTPTEDRQSPGPTENWSRRRHDERAAAPGSRG